MGHFGTHCTLWYVFSADHKLDIYVRVNFQGGGGFQMEMLIPYTLKVCFFWQVSYTETNLEFTLTIFRTNFFKFAIYNYL